MSITKTTIFFSTNVLYGLRPTISEGLGLKEFDDLGKYLGVPLIHKQVTSSSYSYLIHMVQKRLSGWKARTLHLACKITLVKSILSSILIYTMQTSMLPKKTYFDL
ncbi:hypothetical protein GQ457_11G002150 [Hibiscus cannabinus]